MLFEKKNKIIKLLTQALQRCVKRIEIDFFNKSIYAFVVYPSAGFADLGLAISYREDTDLNFEANEGLESELFELLKDHQDLLNKVASRTQTPNYLIASEWQNVSCYNKEFDSLNLLIDNEYDELYDLGFKSNEIESFFFDVIIAALKKLKIRKMFSNPPFEEDLFLGIQFSEGIESEVAVKSSEILNSKKWHDKVLKYTSGNR